MQQLLRISHNERMETTGEEQTTEPTFRFSIRMLLWLVTLVATCLGIFTYPNNLFFLLELFLIYFLLHVNCKRNSIAITVILISATIQIIFIVAHGSVSTPRPVWWSYYSSNQIKVIAKSIHVFKDYDSGKKFPRAQSLNVNNEVLHSWRSQLLPFIEQGPLASTIDYEMPWDDLRNLNLTSRIHIPVYASPRSKSYPFTVPTCNYLAIVDDTTVWPTDGTLSYEDITDNPAETIMLIEHLGSTIPWYEPTDLTMKEAVEILCKPPRTNYQRQSSQFMREIFRIGNYSHYYSSQHLVAFADGHVRRIPPIKDPQIAKALLTRNGGEDLSDWQDSLNFNSFEEAHNTYFICFLQLLFFLALATYPYWQNQSLPTTSPANLSGRE